MIEASLRDSRLPSLFRRAQFGRAKERPPPESRGHSLGGARWRRAARSARSDPLRSGLEAAERFQPAVNRAFRRYAGRGRDASPSQSPSPEKKDRPLVLQRRPLRLRPRTPVYHASDFGTSG